MARPRAFGKQLIKYLIITVLFFLYITFIIFRGSTKTETVYSPREWRDLFAKAGGWTPLLIPDSKFKPGTIFRLADSDPDPRYVDDLDACGYPMAEFEQTSHIPVITFEKAWEFQGDAILNFQGVKAGPQFNRISRVRMQVTDHGVDAFRLLKFKVWLENPKNRAKISPVCMNQLLQRDHYLVTEAFRVSKGRYTLLDKTGAAIKLKAPALGELLQLQPDLKYEISGEGSLIIEQRVCFAVRRAIYVGDFQVLGSPEETARTADGQIENIFWKGSGKK